MWSTKIITGAMPRSTSILGSRFDVLAVFRAACASRSNVTPVPLTPGGCEPFLAGSSRCSRLVML
jgi:hypothetical protein